ncbi:MAG TPA: biotin/lipoyl-containing protein [Thermomicrobiales bacterium]|jgi:sugar O-acyltransferase (sialic acid O-acetyltransferase NeuD family)
MATEVLLPKLGMNTEWATIVAWRKGEGEIVAVGEPLADVETDKAIIELEAESAGMLRRLLVADGTRVAVNQAIAILGTADEDITALEARLAAGPDTNAAHSERVYGNWTGTANGAAATNGATPTPPAAPAPAPLRHIPRSNAPDPDAVRARLAARGILGRPTNGAAHHGANGATPPHEDRLIAQQNGMGTNGTNGTHADPQAAITLSRGIPARPKPQRIAIYGAGLGARQLLEITRQREEFTVIGLIDDKPGLEGGELGGMPVLGGFAALVALAKRGEIDGVTLSFHSEIRRKVHRRLKDAIDLPIVALIDPRAHIGADVRIGAGALIEAGAVVGPGTEIGEGAIVDVGAIVAHDCFIGPFSHLSPGCALSGVVCLRENVLVSVGAAINSTVTVGRNVIITPGAAVMNDFPDDVIVGGVPAKVLGASKRGS